MKLLARKKLVLLLIYIFVIYVSCNKPNFHVAFRTDLLTKLQGFNILKKISNQVDRSYVYEGKDLKEQNIERIKITRAHFPDKISATTTKILQNLDYKLSLTLENMNLDFTTTFKGTEYNSSFELRRLLIDFAFKNSEAPQITNINLDCDYSLQVAFNRWFLPDLTFKVKDLLGLIFQTDLFKEYINKRIMVALAQDFIYSEKIIEKENEDFLITNVKGYKNPYIIQQALSKRKRLRRTKKPNYYIVTDWFALCLDLNNEMKLNDIFENNKEVIKNSFALKKDIAIIVRHHFLIVALANNLRSISVLGNDLKINLEVLMKSFIINLNSISARIQIDLNSKSIIEIDVSFKFSYKNKNLEISFDSFQSNNLFFKVLGKLIMEKQHSNFIKELKQTHLKFSLENYLSYNLAEGLDSHIELYDAMLTHQNDCIVIEFNVNIK